MDSRDVYKSVQWEIGAHLEFLPGFKPIHSCAYTIPHIHDEAFQKELKHLVIIWVLQKYSPTEWFIPMFIIPKKDGRMWWISDLYALNKCLCRLVYLLTKIEEIISHCSKHNHFTKINLAMFYYTLELDKESKEVCTVPSSLYTENTNIVKWRWELK